MSKGRTCIHSLITITKWLPVLVTAVIFSWGWYAYTFQLVLYSQESLVQQVTCLVIFHILYILSLWSYIQTIFSRTGKIPSRFFFTPEFSEEMTKARNDQERDELLAQFAKKNHLPVACRTYSGGIRHCEKCNIVKPDRCHHCSICGVCILKMDHHCPWINNCVSFSNYKFFVLFLGYTFAVCVFVSATTFPYTLSFWNFSDALSHKTSNSTISSEQYQSSPNQNGAPFAVRFHILFLFFVTSMLFLGVMFLYCYHIHLLLKNRSTLEAFRAPLMTYGPDKNAFNLGKKENVLQLFGRSKLLWLVPVFTTEGSGLSYDQRPHLGQGDEEVRQELLNHNMNKSMRGQDCINSNTDV